MSSSRKLLLTAVFALGLCAVASAATTYTNQIIGTSFNPQAMTIQAGDTVVWINADFHSVTGDPPEEFCGQTIFGPGGQCTHTFNVPGTYSYYCIPHRSFGMVGTLTVEPSGPQPPSIAITNPVNNASFTGPTNVLIQASASDSDGTVTQVEFFDGNTSLGIDASSPYEVNPNFALGQHVLRAVATDNLGMSSTSAPVTINITSPRIADPIPAKIAKGDVSIELQPVLEGLSSPLGMAVPDDGSNRIFVYDQVGLVWALNNGVKSPTPALDIRSRLVPLGVYEERGLLGFATHPNFAASPLVYTYSSEPTSGAANFQTTLPPGATNDHQSVIAEWRIDSANPLRVDPTSRREILRIDEPQSNHNGGTMRFGPDGYLYVSLGDGGNADDEGNGHVAGGNGQSLDTVLGKLLRIDINARTSANGQYGVPADNPFVGQAGIDEIYAFGFRNPYTFSFDRSTGALYVGDVGQNFIEEVDLVTKGGNYGWNVKEGSFYFDGNGSGAGYVTTIPVRPVPPDLIDPIAEYDHDEGLAIVGGYVYRGSQIAGLTGKYVAGDWGNFSVPSGRLFYLDNGNVLKELRIGSDDRPFGHWLKGFGEGSDGELYVFVSKTLGPVATSGRMLKIVPVPSAIQITRTQSSATGIDIDWTGGSGQFELERKEGVTDPSWRDLAATTLSTGSGSREAISGFFRVQDIMNQPGIPFTIAMSGAMERPTNAAPGLGFGTARLEGDLFTFDVRYQNLTGPGTAVHIHGPASAAQSAGVLIDLSPYTGGSLGTTGTLSGTIQLTPAQKAMILSGKTYINIHTTQNGGGEIRGQIAPVLMPTYLSGLNERPNPIRSTGIGQVDMYLVGTNLTFNIVYRNLNATATAAHIHAPADSAGTAGVMRDLVPFHDGPLGTSGSFGGTIGLTGPQLANVIDGLSYVNIHTTQNGGGEIRGQLAGKTTAIGLTAWMTGAAEKPTAVSSPGAGFATFRIEGNNLIFEVRYTNLTSQAVGSHIHGPATSTQTAGVMIDLAPYNGGSFGRSGTLVGSLPLTPAQKALILSGQTYINIHTANFGGGEIRGQIGTVLMSSSMAGNNEIPGPVLTAATGSSTLILVGNQISFDVTYRNLSANSTASHFHGPASVFASASVIVDLSPFNGGSYGTTSGSLAGTATLNAVNLGTIIDGLSYLNVHSTARPSGEIRGQVVR